MNESVLNKMTEEMMAVLANIGIPTLIIILFVILLLFGPTKLPQLGSAIGRTLLELKSSFSRATDEDKDAPPVGDMKKVGEEK